MTDAAEEQKPSIRARVQQFTGCDVGVFREKDTWIGFGLSVPIFLGICFAALSLFGSVSSGLGISDEVSPAPLFEVETLNRTEDGGATWNLSQHRGEVVIIDFTSITCSNCEYIAKHMEEKQDEWENLNATYPVTYISIEVWYDDKDQVMKKFGNDTHHLYIPWTVGIYSEDAVYSEENGTTGDIRSYYFALSPPVVYVIDHEGYLVDHMVGYDGLDSKWFDDMDNAVELAANGEAEELRFGLEDPPDDYSGIIFLGLILGILVYFSPCAFPVLPSYIAYYVGLHAREDDLKEQGKLKGKMPNSLVIGSLSGAGMLTFFAIIGVLAFTVSQYIDTANLFRRLSLIVAAIIAILGLFIVMGGTAKLLKFVDKFVDKYSTTEADDIFTPRRNMYLYGIGYAAASIDCTAAAVLPFIAITSGMGTAFVIYGLGALMLSVFLLMVAVTSLVGLGRMAFVDFLRKNTGRIKTMGGFMMFEAGVFLFYLIGSGEFQF